MQAAVALKNDTSSTTRDWLESIPAGIILINAEGLIDCYNKQAAELLGLCDKTKNWSTILKENVKQVVNEGHYIVLESGKCVVFKTQSLPNAKGQLILLVDETDIYRSNNCAMQIQNLDSIEKLSASLAHQLRTPLSTALLYTSSLVVDTNVQEKIMKQLLLIKQQIDDVLVVCKGQEKLIEHIHICDELNKLADDYQQLHPHIHIQFISEKHADKLMVLGHKASLIGALMNIIDNAIQASDAKNLLNIRLQKRSSFICIQVTDFGKGISVENLERIKKPFYTTKQNGTGLGLSIAKSIMEAHQGKLEIESFANEFTTVSLYLPELV
jgi:two-component system sensor histidine kinase FlrB